MIGSHFSISLPPNQAVLSLYYALNYDFAMITVGWRILVSRSSLQVLASDQAISNETPNLESRSSPIHAMPLVALVIVSADRSYLK